MYKFLKKAIILLTIFVFAICILTACNKEPEVPEVKEYYGTYIGNNDYSITINNEGMHIQNGGTTESYSDYNVSETEILYKENQKIYRYENGNVLTYAADGSQFFNLACDTPTRNSNFSGEWIYYDNNLGVVLTYQFSLLGNFTRTQVLENEYNIGTYTLNDGVLILSFQNFSDNTNKKEYFYIDNNLDLHYKNVYIRNPHIFEAKNSSNDTQVDNTLSTAEDYKAKILNVKNATITDLTINMEVSPEIDTVDLSGMVTTSAKSDWSLYMDTTGQVLIPTKLAVLNDGTNTFYIVVNSEDGTINRTYTLKIFRNFYTSIIGLANDTVVYKKDNVLSHTQVELELPSAMPGYALTWEVNSYYVEEHNKIFYAEATANTYNISLNGDGANLSQNKQTVVYNHNYTLPIPQLADKIFVGWAIEDTLFTNSNGESLVPYNFVNDISLTACYIDKSYNINITSEDNNKGTVNYLLSGQYVKDTTLQLSATPNYGCFFAGWYKDGVIVSNESNYTVATPNVDTTFVAKFYYLDVNSEDTSMGNAQMTKATDIGVQITATPNTGCYFIGWYNGSQLISNESTLIIDKIEQNTSLVAKYGFLKYDINYHLYDGTFKTEEQSYYTINALPYTLPSPTKKDCSFVGWYTDNTFLGSSITFLPEDDLISYDLHARFVYNDPIKHLSFAEIDGTAIVMGYVGAPLKIEIPTTYNDKPVTSINNGAFLNCSAENLYIPNSITKIGNGAFEGCNKITTANIPTNLSNAIPKENLIKVTLSGSGKVENSAFSNLNNLTKVVIEDNIHEIGTSAFANCNNLTTISVNSPLTNISTRAFENCSALSILQLGNTLTDIGVSAFANCTSLTKLILHATTKQISKNAFDNCTSLINVDLGNALESIGDSVFNNCSNLQNVTIPSTVKTFGKAVFDNCISLNYNQKDYIKYVGNSNNPYAYCIGTLVYTSDTLIFDDNCLLVASNALDRCKVTRSYLPTQLSHIVKEYSIEEIVLTGDTTTIGTGLFKDCSTLKRVVISDSITSIGKEAFSGCSGLSLVSIGDSVTSIGAYAFYKCTNLISITIPNSVTRIEGEAFNQCSKLVEVYNLSTLNIIKGSSNNGWAGYYAKNVYTPTSGESKLSTDSNGYIIYTAGENKILVGYTGSETELVLPEDIKEIHQFAFYNCNRITSVTIPNSVLFIEDDAFAYCSSLTNVTIGNNVGYIGDEVFYGCSSLTSVTIPDSVTCIGSYAFRDCDSLTSITFEDTSTWYRTIQSSDWQNKTGGKLTYVSTPTNNDEIFVDNYYNYYWYKK